MNGDDAAFVLAARATIEIVESGEYTFGFNSDEGARLRLHGAVCTDSVSLYGSNPAQPAHQGNTLSYPGNTPRSATLGVTSLMPGLYHANP